MGGTLVTVVTLGILAGSAPADELRRDFFATALRAGERGAHERAVRALLAGPVPSDAALRAALTDDDYRVRRRACRLILILGEEKWVPTLVALIDRHEPWAEARIAMAWTAYRLGYAPALDVVRRGVHNPYWHRRLNAMADLDVLEDAGASPFFAGALQDPYWLVRRRAILALRRLDPRPYAAALLEATNDEEWVIRREAIAALLELGKGVDEEQLAGVLTRALFDPELPIRRLVAQALPARNDAIDVAMAFSAEHDQDNVVRASLLRALGPRPDPEGENARLFKNALVDRSWVVRAAATEALRGREPKGLERLVAVLPLLTPHEAKIAAQALLRIGDPAAVRLLVRSALRGGLVAQLAQTLLAELGRGPAAWKDAVLGATRDLLAERSEGARAAGADLAARLGAGDLAPKLVKLAGDASAAVRAAAARAIERVSDRLSLEERNGVALALATSAGSPPSPLRNAARDALRALTRRGLAPGSLRSLASAAVRWVRRMSLRALAAVGAGAESARKALSDPEPEVRSAAISTLAAALPLRQSDLLASLGNPPAPMNDRRRSRSIAEIAACLDDPVALVRRAAARALATLGRPRRVPGLDVVLREDLRSPDASVRRRAAGDLARLAGGGEAAAREALVPALADTAVEVRVVAQAALRRGPIPKALRTAAERAPAPLRHAAAWMLAERGISEGLAGVLAPLTRVDVAEVERLGEYQPARLGALLSERVPAASRTWALRDFLVRFVAPELCGRLADALGREVVTHWRGTPIYNMRRQNLYNAEIAAAIRDLPGLHPRILKALLFQESNFEPYAGNHFDCVGLGAFCRGAAREEGMPPSAQFRDFEGDLRYDPAHAVRASVHHLRRKAQLLEQGPFRKYGTPRGDNYWAFVLAAYNGGHEQVGQAMAKAHEHGLELAKASGLHRAAAKTFAREYATRWDDIIAPTEEPEDTPLYAMTERRYPWYRPYGRYRKMTGAEAKYHEIGNFPLDILDRAFQGEDRKAKIN